MEGKDEEYDYLFKGYYNLNSLYEHFESDN